VDTQTARELAAIRGEFAQLRGALGAVDPGDLFQVLRRVIASLRDLQQRVAALEAQAGVITAAGGVLIRQRRMTGTGTAL
jgi:hypothetical protein